MKYRVTIEETIAEDFEIEAASREEAARIAREKYKSQEIVLEPGYLETADIFVDGECVDRIY